MVLRDPKKTNMIIEVSMIFTRYNKKIFTNLKSGSTIVLVFKPTLVVPKINNVGYLGTDCFPFLQPDF